MSCTYEDGNPVLMEDLKFLRQLIEDDNQFLEITALGKELAWNVVKLWMHSEGRNLTNFQVGSGIIPRIVWYYFLIRNRVLMEISLNNPFRPVFTFYAPWRSVANCFGPL